MLQLGDYVKYPRGERIYEVTQVRNTFVELDAHYQVNPTKVVKLNKFNNGQEIIVGDSPSEHLTIIGIRKHGGGILYDVIDDRGHSTSLNQNLIIELKDNYENENRLCKETTPERGGDLTGVSRELCRGNCRYDQFRHCCHEVRIDKSSEYLKRCYEQLSMEQ